MAGNSTLTLQSIVDDALSCGDLAPALATGGWSDQPSLSIANDVLDAMLLGGPDGQPLNWKWNRFNVPSFPTISFQQDYFIPGLVTLGWLEHCWAVDINSTALPKNKRQIEVKRDLDVTDLQTGYPNKICWIQADLVSAGTWGAVPLGPTTGNLNGGGQAGLGLSGLQNPGPNVIYTNPIGVTTNAQPVNATTNIKDPNGNLWALTQYGTCGATQPTWPTTIVYPTQQQPTLTATTVTDGTVVWTAINPDGQALRLSPLPPQTGIVWVVQPVGQLRPVMFKSLGQLLNPIPDDYSKYFKMGFFAQCFRRSPDAKVRAKFKDEWALFLRDLDMSVKQGQREPDDYGFYPGTSVMDNSLAYSPINPAQPYNR
jgi:hypothetical protein